MMRSSDIGNQNLSSRWVAGFVFVILLGIAVLMIWYDASKDSIHIQYREIVDQTNYGHSGRLATEVLKALSIVEQATSDGVAPAKTGHLAQSHPASPFGFHDMTGDAMSNMPSNAMPNMLGTPMTIPDRFELTRYFERNYSGFDPKPESQEEKNYKSFFRQYLNRIRYDHLAKKPKTSIVKYEFQPPESNGLAQSVVQQLAADVEPICEPTSYILNDSLARTNPATLNPKLVELRSFYPAGRSEPGWADLVRSGRIVVYTDGGSYCRLFLPGKNSREAWDSNYSVVRHILRSLLKADDAGARINVDVYAYENDIPTTTLKLHLKKFASEFSARDLGTPPGRVPLDLGQLAGFFAAGLSLEGCAVDPAGRLVLIGSNGGTPTLEGHPIELSDLAVAYRASAYAGHGESYMSLDPCEDKNFVNVNFGGRLQDTRQGWVAYRCDLRFKTLATGFDPATFENLESKIRGNLSAFETLTKRWFTGSGRGMFPEENTQFWFEPTGIRVVAGGNDKSCLVENPRFTADARRILNSGVGGFSLATTTPAWTSSTLDDFNRDYDEFAQIFPEVGELDHVARLLAVGEWLFQASQKGVISLDLDELLAIPLPASPTPRRREQLRVELLLMRDGSPTGFVGYCVSSPRVRNQYKRKTEGNQSYLHIATTISGGLNLNFRESVAQAEKAEEEEEQNILDQASAGAKFSQGSRCEKLTTSIGFSGPPPVGPPNDGIVTADAAIPAPDGMGEAVTMRRAALVATAIATHQAGIIHHQTQSADAFFVDGPVHSIWADEHGRPERFTAKIASEVVTFSLEAHEGDLTAKRIDEKRAPTNAEADLLASTIAERKLSTSQAWTLVPVDANLLAIDVTPGRVILIYYQEGEDRVVRVYEDGRKTVEFRGTEALSRMHEASREKVRAFSVPGKVELLHAAGEGDDIVLQIGRRDPIRVNAEAWKSWLSNDDETAAPPEAVARIFEELERSGAELVVMRDALQSKPQRLREAEPIVDNDAVTLTGMLKSRLSKLRVSYDDPSAVVQHRVTSEPLVRSRADVGLAIPPGDAGVDDKGILKTIAAFFQRDQIPLIKSPADLAKVGNVIIVTAHNNQALFEYIQTLGDHQIDGKSALDGKILMLTTCFEEGNPNLVSELLRRYNCGGVHVQAARVDKDAVKRVMIELSKRLSKLERGASPRKLRDIYDEVVRELRDSKDEDLKDLKPEFEKLLEARIQWCLNRPNIPRQTLEWAA